MSEIKDKNKEELLKLRRDKRGTLREFRFGISGSKIRNVREGRNTRKEIARINTALSGMSS